MNPLPNVITTARRQPRLLGLAVIVVATLGGVAVTPAPALSPEPQDAFSQGEALLAEAREHLAAQRWASAERAYAEALRFMPGNLEAIEGQREALRMLNQASSIQDVDQETAVLRERARVEFDNAMNRARELLAQNDFNGAMQVALTGQIQLRQNERLFRESEFASRMRQSEGLLTEVDHAREVERLRAEQQQRIEAAERQRAAQEAEASKMKDEIRERLKRVRQLQQAQKYEEALQIIDEILFFDDLEPTALMLKDLLETLAIYSRFSDIQRAKEMNLAADRLEGQSRMIMPRPNRSGPGPRGVSDLMVYPEDWPGLSIMRTGEIGFAESPADRAVSQVLNTRTVAPDFSGNTFEQVVNFMESVTGVKFYVDWKALDIIGVTRDEEVSLQLDEVTSSTVLDRVLEQLGDDIDRPQWAIRDGILTISSDEALRKYVTSVVYDIRDLLFEVPYYGNAPDLDLDSALSQSGNQGGG
ncbi:MAG: hypothetical protein KJO43_13200, partial [Phycisphaerae bacterium]|nr:hypothetical protein [Phycisphaerae bacterium]